MKRSSLAFGLLLFAVVCAGVASLLYEVLWIRQLGLSLGSTAVATSVMLSAFLGGLALGSWIISKWADDFKEPFLVFAGVEVVAAVLGLASIPALAYAGRAYLLISNSFGASGFASLALRSCFAAIVMLIPALLFGMTFPIATVIGTRLIGGQKAAGIISATSSFGSAIGALLAGLYLEPVFGIMKSAQIGMAINLAAAAAAMLGFLLLRDALKKD